MVSLGLRRLRVHAISQSLFHTTTVKTAIERLGFVQADPIRVPARAHDLILRHRVLGYQVGDLEREYPSLNIEEDRLYAYGFLPRTNQQLLYPRRVGPLSKFEKVVLDAVREFDSVHPSELEIRFGNQRVINDWGGYSKATTRALDSLHNRGLLRVARRENGIRVYEVASPYTNILEPAERLRKLVMVMANILAPVPMETLQANLAQYGHLGNTRAVLAALIRSGELEQQTIEGAAYVWPPFLGTIPDEAPESVRFLAPFDPLVWDRRRFEHLWGWPYRFEAYTPVAKRLRGYYAMPLLWGNNISGWVNAKVFQGHLNVELGFVGMRPRDANFRSELGLEIRRVKAFLKIEKWSDYLLETV